MKYINVKCYCSSRHIVEYVEYVEPYKTHILTDKT